MPPFDASKEVGIMPYRKYKVLVNVFRCIWSTVTAIAHIIYRKSLLPWYGKLTMF